jgi:hypothetical protein
VYGPSELKNTQTYPLLTKRNNLLVVFKQLTKSDDYIILDVILDTEINLKLHELDPTSVAGQAS